MNLIIIGAGKGISQATAKIFGAQGFRVGLISRSEEKLNSLADELAALGVDTAVSAADVAHAGALEAAVEQIISLHGTPDVVLFNAYTYRAKAIQDETWDAIKQQMDINAGGAFHVLKKFLPLFLSRGQGKLFFTGGGLALKPMPRMLGLSMGKAAMRNLVLAASSVASGSNVHVATITVNGIVREGDARYTPHAIAELYWSLYQQQRGEYQPEIVY